MKFWLDTEFNEHGGALISIALVAENGTDWYAVLPCEKPGAWVGEHVIPVLGRPASSRTEAQWSLKAYLAQFDSAHVIADWPIDIAHFCELLITGPGQRIDTPRLSFEINRDLPPTADLSTVPHNALFDAWALRDHECCR